MDVIISERSLNNDINHKSLRLEDCIDCFSFNKIDVIFSAMDFFDLLLCIFLVSYLFVDLTYKQQF
jgi:hypothetical protein